MVLTTYEWLYGISQIAAVVLSIVSGIVASSMLRVSSKQKSLRGWKYLLIALILFAVEELFGALRTFGLYSNEWITHVIPSFILVFLIAALCKEINVAKGWLE